MDVFLIMFPRRQGRLAAQLSLLIANALVAGCRHDSPDKESTQPAATPKVAQRASPPPDKRASGSPGRSGRGRFGSKPSEAALPDPSPAEAAVVALARQLGGSAERSDRPGRPISMIRLPNPSDEDLAIVARLPVIDMLRLEGSGFTDKGLATIAGVKELSTLHLCGESITDKGIARLEGHETLRILILERVSLGSEGLTALSGNEALTYVDLIDTAITPQLLEGLEQLRMIRELRLIHTDISDEDRALLEEHLPNCDVVVETEERP